MDHLRYEKGRNYIEGNIHEFSPDDILDRDSDSVGDGVSASVHHATLKTDGSTVAVKIFKDHIDGKARAKVSKLDMRAASSYKFLLAICQRTAKCGLRRFEGLREYSRVQGVLRQGRVEKSLSRSNYSCMGSWWDDERIYKK